MTDGKLLSGPGKSCATFTGLLVRFRKWSLCFIWKISYRTFNRVDKHFLKCKCDWKMRSKNIGGTELHVSFMLLYFCSVFYCFFFSNYFLIYRVDVFFKFWKKSCKPLNYHNHKKIRNGQHQSFHYLLCNRKTYNYSW